MTAISAETLLAVALLALYLQDSASLLHFDDVVISGTRAGWEVSTGSELELRGRFLFLPNPLWPARTQFRASWLHPDSAATGDTDVLARFACTLWPVRIGCVLAGAALLVVLPALLLGAREPLWLLYALATGYAAIIAMLVALFLRRKALGLTGRRFTALAAESLLCPPHAVNLHRRLCALRGFGDDPVAFAAHAMPEDGRHRLRDALDARIALFALDDEDASGHAAALRDARRRIEALLA